MSDLPAPMVPPGCDLRGFMEWSRFFGERVFKSHWYQAALNDPRGGIAALKLWWTAMLECPAGSLPNDEKWLCRMADFGQDIRSWRKHRTTAMHGFVLCADGRWYHPFLAEEARSAWERRQKSDRNRDLTAERTRQWRQRSNGAGDASHTTSQYASRDAPVTGDVTSRAERLQEKRRESPPRSPPSRGGRTTREDRIVSGGIALVIERAAAKPREQAAPANVEDLCDPSSYLRIVESGRG